MVHLYQTIFYRQEHKIELLNGVIVIEIKENKEILDCLKTTKVLK